MTYRPTFGVQKDRLIRLLEVAAGNQSEQPLDASAWKRLLEDRLAAPLALEPQVADSVTEVLGGPCPELVPLTGRPLGEIVTDAEAGLDVLTALKDYGRALALRWEEGPEHAMATIIYHAAIAAALVFHGKNVSSRCLADLAQTMGIMASTPWITPPMAALFSKARRFCNENQQPGAQ